MHGQYNKPQKSNRVNYWPHSFGFARSIESSYLESAQAKPQQLVVGLKERFQAKIKVTILTDSSIFGIARHDTEAQARVWYTSGARICLPQNTFSSWLQEVRFGPKASPKMLVSLYRCASGQPLRMSTPPASKKGGIADVEAQGCSGATVVAHCRISAS